MTTDHLIYKIIDRAMWERAQKDGVFRGAPVDLADGYIHFSTAEQAAETASKHFHGQDDLMLLAIAVWDLPVETLKWEPSRGGALFPHLYADLPAASVRWAKPLPWRDGVHVFPEMA